MFTLRNLGGIALLLAGSTWMWLTPAFASRDVNTTGWLWATTQVLCLITMVGFVVATLGLFTRHSWWEVVALASAAVGLLTLIPYGLAAVQGGETPGTTAWSIFVHVLMVGGVYALLLVPSLEHWVNHRVMSG